MNLSQIRLLDGTAKLVCNERSVQLNDNQSFTQIEPGEWVLNSPDILNDRMVNTKYDIW